MSLGDQFRRAAAAHEPTSFCAICVMAIVGETPPFKRYGDQPVHEDCYFRKLSDLLESAPPCGSLRVLLAQGSDQER